MITAAKSIAGIKSKIIKLEDDYNPALHPEDGYDSNGKVTEEAKYIRKQQQITQAENKKATDLANKGLGIITAYNSDPNAIPYHDSYTYKDFRDFYDNNGVVNSLGTMFQQMFDDINNDPALNALGRALGLDKVGDAVSNVGKTAKEGVDKVKSYVEELLKNNNPNNNPYLTSPTTNSAYSASSGSASTAPSGFGIEELLNRMEEMQNKNNAWNAEQAQKQMDFQERMSRNAHTYEVEDLQRAGLNPVLSAGAGSGAQVGNGAMAQADTSLNSDILNLAMMSVDAMANTAQSFAAVGTKKDSGFFSWLNNDRVMKTISNVGKVASTASTVLRLFGI